MNLWVLKATDKELQQVKLQQNKVGKEARTEIQRRKLIGSYDGTNAPIIEESA